MTSLNLLRFLTTVCLGATLHAAPHSAIDPVPRTDPSWKDRQKLLNQRAADAGEKAQVIFIGDSITQGWEGDGSREIWNRYYAHRNAVNLGIGGDRTQHVLWRLENGNLNGLKPKAAVIMIGTNNSNGEDNSVEQIADGVAAIVQKLRSTLPDTKILLLAIFPRGESPNPQRGKVLMVNQVIQKLADEKDVFWFDLGSFFVNSNGLIPRSMMPDYLHLSPLAYSIWAGVIEGRLATILGDTPVQPQPSVATNLSGDWIWTIPGPDGNPVSAVLVLTQDGPTLKGRFARPGDRWLETEGGQLNNNEFTWTVKRDRPSGESMVYRMTGKIEGDSIKGKATTTMDGNEVTVDWSAKRK